MPPAPSPRTQPPPASRTRPAEGGAVLILVLIFSVLLYVVISQLVTTAKMARLAGDNDVVMERMDNQMRAVVLPQIEQLLLDDLQAADAGAAAGGEGLPGGSGAAGGSQGAGGLGGEEAEEDPPCDSSQDAWFKPTGYSSGDLTVYVFVEDENRKFNILSVASPNEEFARVSKERLVRLIDSLRENTDYDVNQSDAQNIAESIEGWIRGRDRNEDFRPKPKLKSDEPQRGELTIPLHLDELLLLRHVSKDLFFDKVYEDADRQPRLLPGLESVLTIYTSWRADPGTPEQLQRQAAANQTARNDAAAPAAAGAVAEAAKPEGQGIRINVNTATRPVLRCLFSAGEVPDAVIDAILKYRNTELPPEENEDPTADYAGDVRESEDTKKQVFKSLEDLDKVPEFKNLADPKVRDALLNMLTVNSDVFSVHFAAMFKRNEKRKVFVLSRRRSVLVRIEGDSDPRLHPLIHMERRGGLRLFPQDNTADERDRQRVLQQDMDEFARDELAWNPFRVEFFRRDDDDQ